MRLPHLPPCLLTAITIASLSAAPFAVAQAPDTMKRLVVPGTFGEKTYDNVRVMGATEQGLKVVHDAGISVLPFKSLPQEWQTKYAPPAPTEPTTTMPDAPASGSSKTTAPSSGEGFDPACLVFIKTDAGSGSGFVARVDGRTYVYTNAHVICGEPGSFTKKIVSIKTATGKAIATPYDLELSNMSDATSEKGLEDLARFPIALKEGEPAYDIGGLDVSSSMDQAVIAYGNSLGGDVMTSLKGSIVGLGTDRIEISCNIVPGNSGGPVLFKDTRQVVGVSTYLTTGERDIWAGGTQFGNVRRFALRPEKVTKWRKMLYSSLMSSLAELQAFDRDTLSLAAACFLNPRPNRGGFDVPNNRQGNYVIREVLADGSKHHLGATIVAGITRVNQRLAGANGTLAINDVVPVFATFFASVAGESDSQMSSLAIADRAPYIKQFIPELVELRGKIQARFIQEGNTRYR